MFDKKFKESVRISFEKFRDHMIYLEGQIKIQNRLFIDVKNELKKLDNRLSFLEKRVETLENTKPLKTKLPLEEGVSIGKEGVQQHIPNTSQTHPKHKITKYAFLKDIKTDFESRFRILTGKQFLVFIAIYQLEEELSRAVTYKDLTNRLKTLTFSTVRGHIMELISKGVPLIKYRANRQVYLSIPDEFRDLNLVSKLIKLRQFDLSQRGLF